MVYISSVILWHVQGAMLRYISAITFSLILKASVVEVKRGGWGCFNICGATSSVILFNIPMLCVIHLYSYLPPL